MRTRVLALLAGLWLAAGAWGGWNYTHDYIIYRGFPPPHDPPGVRAGRLERVTFPSAALRRRRAYEIYVPPGAHGRLPVLYLLHGSPGSPRLFVSAGALGVALDTLIARREVRPFYVVMPDGRNGSFRSDTEWADTPHGRFEHFLLDVVGAVDRRWPTLADRSHRAIAGNSEGAYGAVNVGLRHLAVFAGIESWSGYFTQTATGPFAHADRATVRANSPAEYVTGLAPRLRRLPLRVFLYGGARDKGADALRPFADRLRAAGAHVTIGIWPGRHDWGLWRARTSLMLRAADQDFRVGT
jgi:enterochelin esterase-like enzyme